MADMPKLDMAHKIVDSLVDAANLFLLAQHLGGGKEGEAPSVERGAKMPQFKGGIWSDDDEREEAKLNVKLKRNPTAAKIYREFQTHELGKKQRLEKKLGSFGAGRVTTYVMNRQRTILNGIKAGEGTPIGSKTIRRYGAKVGGARGPSSFVETKIDLVRAGGGATSLDVVLLLCEVIEERRGELRTSGRYSREETIKQKAMAAGEEFLEGCGIPRIPDPDDVVDIMAALDWAKKRGLKGFEELDETIQQIEQLARRASVNTTRREQLARRKPFRPLPFRRNSATGRWEMCWPSLPIMRPLLWLSDLFD